MGQSETSKQVQQYRLETAMKDLEQKLKEENALDVLEAALSLLDMLPEDTMFPESTMDKKQSPK